MPIQNTQRNVFLMSIITENNHLQKKAAFMNEFPKRKVVEHNDLISSVAKMDKVPLKIFELAVSCIDTDNPPKDNIVFLSKRELFAFFDVSDSNKHSRFREAIEKMQKTAYFEIKEVKDKGYKMKSIVPIPMVEWNSYNNEVKIRFDIDIMPYLIELKQNFTQYALTDVMELNSKYSIIIYKWLCMHFNQYEHYQNKGGRRHNQLEEYRNPSIPMNELRVLTDTVTEYKRFTHFETRILKTAIQEINEHTHYNPRSVARLAQAGMQRSGAATRGARKRCALRRIGHATFHPGVLGPWHRARTLAGHFLARSARCPPLENTYSTGRTRAQRYRAGTFSTLWCEQTGLVPGKSSCGTSCTPTASTGGRTAGKFHFGQFA